MTRRDHAPQTASQAAPLTHLVTQQDAHAYIDGEVPPARRAAVEAHLARCPAAARRTAEDLRLTLCLRAARDQLYADPALRDAVTGLLAKRGRPRTQERSSGRASA